MSPRDWQERIRDILDAISEVKAFTADLDRAGFLADTRTQRAVEMGFIIIGEAANHVPESVQDTHSEVPWHLMRAMRNRLVHVYFNVDPEVMWQTLQQDLPLLEEPLQELLRH